MTAKNWLTASVVAILLAGSGCVCCGNKGHGLARVAGPDCDVPSGQRNQVYIFAVSGLNPVGLMALDGFREELNRHGFAKIATGTTAHAPWMAREMRRIRADDPNAVFVLVGTESATATAVRLAEKAVAGGLPVGGVVLIDHAAKTPAPVNGVRTLTIGSGYGSAACSTVESVAVPDAGRFCLTADPRTIAAVTRLLNEVAAGTAQPLPVEAECLYPHAAPERPWVEVGPALEWAFLFDQPGTPGKPLGEGTQVIPTSPAVPAAPPAPNNP